MIMTLPFLKCSWDELLTTGDLSLSMHIKICAFIFQIPGWTSPPSVVGSDIFSLASLLSVEAGEGEVQGAIGLQRSILKDHSISQVMGVLWHTAAADQNGSDECSQLQPWLCWIMLLEPYGFSVSCRTRRNLDSPCDFLVISFSWWTSLMQTGLSSSS